ncbi:nuclear transport factor 2 family protein [Halobacteria archaeon AArc-m2/3/4]|uniref:Nuclear transport factor 2 family protein n=1 Tax=Natronoglomus mannanivorans TaxID=2979990 RepID=A0ABT2QFG0_9EURY|nr:nuclear transport factor 2 family protein [Halobacteria archaeon AArc-m2/3/4]
MAGSVDGDGDGGDEDSAESLVRAYYRALDDHEYGTLESLLEPAFTQRRPDRTFEDREAFVRFMREDRPMTDTSHEVLAVIVGSGDGDENGAENRVAVQGRLLDGSGDAVFRFADVFTLEDGRIRRLETYTQ